MLERLNSTLIALTDSKLNSKQVMHYSSQLLKSGHDLKSNVLPRNLFNDNLIVKKENIWCFYLKFHVIFTAIFVIKHLLSNAEKSNRTKRFVASHEIGLISFIFVVVRSSPFICLLIYDIFYFTIET